MPPSPTQRVAIAGRGAASDYAGRLLGDLGVALRLEEGPADATPARAWAASGAMALSGEPDAPPRVPRVAIASATEGVGRALAALGIPAPRDAAALLGERASLAGLRRRGRTSPGGSCRLLRAADGWAALQLARDDDRRALAAWLEAEPGHESWSFVAREVARRTRAELAERARWLGLPFAAAGAPAAQRDWFRAWRCGARGPQPRRAPRVLDFSSLWAGPLCTSLLADAGADVIKIESRQRPDGARRGAPTFFERLNAGKRSVQLDFSAAHDRALLHALLASADAVVESSRPRALAQLGIDAERFVAAQPGRVWLALSGYGRDDPAPGRVAFGDDAGVAAGLADSVADAEGPLFCGDAIADPLSGLHAALAFWAHWQAGGGVLLDLALRDVAAFVLREAAPVGDFAVHGTAERCRVEDESGSSEVAAPRARPLHRRARPAGADTAALRRELAC